jgi:hypothetical protein
MTFTTPNLPKGDDISDLNLDDDGFFYIKNEHLFQLAKPGSVDGYGLSVIAVGWCQMI